MNRRDMLLKTGALAAALGLSRLPLGWAADSSKPRILMFTRSQGFEHSVVKRNKPDELSFCEKIVTDLAAGHGFEVTCTKDGRVFTPENIAKYDGFFFITTGDLTAKDSKDNSPPMSKEGKKALLDAIAAGKGFVGSHCASDTFHSPGDKFSNQPPDQVDPYIAMLGGEFIIHGEQMKSKIHVVDTAFPGAHHLKDFELHEEWYALKNFAPDLHVILVQETPSMKHDGKNWMYDRPPYPETWARMHGKGRVFFTSMGHREDVWENPLFKNLLVGAVSWTTGRVSADIPPNLDKTAPQASQLAANPAKKK